MFRKQKPMYRKNKNWIFKLYKVCVFSCVWILLVDLCNRVSFVNTLVTVVGSGGLRRAVTRGDFPWSRLWSPEDGDGAVRRGDFPWSTSQKSDVAYKFTFF